MTSLSIGPPKTGSGKKHSGIRHPAFWNKAGAGWTYRGMFEELPFPADWPVYASHAEAATYARWSKQTLPTEAQWHRAAYGTPEGAEQSYPWGSAAPHTALGNFDFARWDPAPVGAYPANQSSFGVAGLLGNGWEWTSSDLRAIFRLSAVCVLSRLFSKFFRQPAFRNQGWVGAHRRLPATAFIP